MEMSFRISSEEIVERDINPESEVFRLGGFERRIGEAGERMSKTFFSKKETKSLEEREGGGVQYRDTEERGADGEEFPGVKSRGVNLREVKG